MYENLIKKGLSSFYAICLIGDMNINSLDYEAHNVQKNSWKNSSIADIWQDPKFVFPND